MVDEICFQEMPVRLDEPVSETLFFSTTERFRAPSPMLAELVYVSRRQAAFDDVQLVNMAVDAGVRNYLSGISSQLWYSRSHLLQVIEGTHTNVEAIFARICRDARHTDLHCLTRRKLLTRRFQRPMWIFRGDDDASFRSYIDPALATTGFDDICESLARLQPAC